MTKHFICVMQKKFRTQICMSKKLFPSFQNISSDFTLELKMCCVWHFLTGKRRSSFLRKWRIEPSTGWFWEGCYGNVSVICIKCFFNPQSLFLVLEISFRAPVSVLLFVDHHLGSINQLCLNEFKQKQYMKWPLLYCVLIFKPSRGHASYCLAPVQCTNP